MLEADLAGLVARTLKNHPARRILESLAKVLLPAAVNTAHSYSSGASE